MIRRFGKRAHSIGKSQCLGKVAKNEGFLQLRDGIAGFDLPAIQLAEQLGLLSDAKRHGAWPARVAGFLA